MNQELEQILKWVSDRSCAEGYYGAAYSDSMTEQRLARIQKVALRRLQKMIREEFYKGMDVGVDYAEPDFKCGYKPAEWRPYIPKQFNEQLKKVSDIWNSDKARKK